MTIDEFWERYNHCPKCRGYLIQGDMCRGCKWEFPIFEDRTDKLDKFDPTEECIRLMNKMIQE